MRDEAAFDVAAAVEAAASGDRLAWDALVDRYTATLWAVARSHRLPQPEAADVVQTTWLRFVEHLARLRDPARAGAWLVTTARRESLRAIRRSARSVPTDDELRLEAGADRVAEPGPEEAVVAGEERARLWAALSGLDDRCRHLLRMLVADPAPSYEEVGAALDMPIGSIGPTRARCLDRLRRLAGTSGITASAGGSV
jgi:RNA polymerase sigma factor (sigma-70 family)